MLRSRFDHAHRLLFVLLFAAIPVAASGQDTSSVDGTQLDQDKGSLNIQIDEQGIRIEGQAQDADSASRITFDPRIRVDTRERREYREVGTDIVKFGEDVFVDPDDLVRGDIVVFGANVAVRGKVLGNVVVMAGDADILDDAEVRGDVVVLGGELVAGPGALIEGESVMFRDFPNAEAISAFFGSNARFIAFFFVPVQFFISLILSFLIILFMRERIIRSHNHVMSSVLKSFGAGFLAVFVGSFLVVVLFLILLITLIGIPLALMLVVSCIAVFVISRTVFVYSLGAMISRKINVQTQNPFAIVMLGTAVLYLPALLGYGISLWPFGSPLGVLFKGFGFLFSTFAYLVGLGALFLSRFGSRGVAPSPDVPATVAE